MYVINCIWNTRVRKYNLRGLENIMNMKNISEIELNCISGWRLAPLRKERMNGIVHDD